ncbi:MAG: carboxypeptidase regulatory-like domain-containing protein [Acidobacteriota bacterium]
MAHRVIGALVLVWTSLALAQTPTGALVGVVTDATDSLIAGAEVKARNVETNFAQTATTSAEGLYRFPALALGSYEITVEAKGFKRFAQSDILIRTAQAVRVDARLEVGEVSASVEVTGAAINVDVETSTLRGVVDTRQVAELPLNGRDVTRLVLLVPGTVDFPVARFQQAFSFPGRSGIPANGGRSNMVNYALDGSNANDNYTNVNNPMPNPDVVQEITVQTASFSARYGQSGGAVVNVVTRSGGNSLHGSAFEYLRNDALNAKSLFTNRTDGLKRNQFGFSLGGPVYVPGVYNGRNRTFFFNSYQGTRTRTSASSSQVILPTEPQRNGDFSAITRPLVDPDTQAPFAGNRIPASQIGSVAKRLYSYLPAPPPLAGFTPGTMFVLFPNEEDLFEYLVKIDHQTGSRNQLSGRYFITNYRQPSYYDGTNLVTARGGKDSRYQSAAINDMYTLGPNLVNQFIFSYDRTQTLSSLGVPLSARDDLGVNIYAPKPSQIQFGVSGYFGINTGVDFRSPRNSFQWADNLNYTRGRHQFAFGANVSRLQMALDNPFILTGSWTYNGSRSGNQLADLALGRPSSFVQGGGQYVQMRGTLYGLYVQDDFKVGRRLTLNLGVRYEPYVPFHDKFGRGATFAPGKQSQRFPNAPAGILYEGDPGVGSGHQQRDWLNWAPRVGFAWDPFGERRFSVRGGYGVFYDINPTKTYIGFGQVPPFSSQVDVFNPPSDADPLRLVGNPFPLPPPSKTTPIPRPVSLSARDPNRRSSYIQNWNLTLEREIRSNLVARASYVGSKGTKLETAYEANPAVFIPGQSTGGNINARRLYAAAGLGAVNSASTEGLSTYQGMQLSLDHRLRDRLALQVSYSLAKSIDNIAIENGTSPLFDNPFNKNAYRGISDFDATHRFVLGYVWTLPTVKPVSRLARFLIGSWSTSGVLAAQTGLPFTVRPGQDRSLSGVNLDHADVVGDPKLSNPSMAVWFNRAAFAAPPLGSFGNAGRNILRAPGFWNLDWSVAKDFPFAEGRLLQFRSEFFNAFNHVNPSGPTATLTSPNFGRILGYRGPRTVQLSLRLNF